jgi:hypothetical protein
MKSNFAIAVFLTLICLKPLPESHYLKSIFSHYHNHALHLSENSRKNSLLAVQLLNDFNYLNRPLIPPLRCAQDGN